MGENIDEIIVNKCLTLVPTDESKEIIKIHAELQSTVRDQMRSITNNSNNYDETYMNIKFNSDKENARTL